MKKFNTINIAAISAFFNSEDVVSLVTKSIPDKPLFLVKMLPLRDNGLFYYSLSSDEQVSVPCVVTQSRYKVADMYKIELAPTVPGFGKQSYYVMDFAQLLRAGAFRVIDQNAPDVIEPTGLAGLLQRCKEYLASKASRRSKRQAGPSLKVRAARRFGQLFGRPAPIQAPH